MELSWAPYRLEFKHPFRLATGTRTGTDSVFVKLVSDGRIGYGEATLPPYLSENQESVINYLRGLDLQRFDLNSPSEQVIQAIHQNPAENAFARCAVEEAYLQLSQIMPGLDSSTPSKEAISSFTLGMGNEEETIQKLEEAQSFPLLKIKLGSERDRSSIELIRRYTDKPLCIDANQGWKDVKEAISFSFWLKDQNVLLIEQPFAASDYSSHQRFSEKSALPVIADESIQSLLDLREYHHCFKGVNIKLLKCGGPMEAEKMIRFAKEKKLFTLIGCMSESSCGVYHASQFRFQADLMDLDGPYLIKNDPFTGYAIENGKIITGRLNLVSDMNFERI